MLGWLVKNTLKGMGKEGWKKKEVSEVKFYPDTCLDERMKYINTLQLVSQNGDYDSN